MLNSQETLSQKFVNRGSWIFLFTIIGAPLGYIIKIFLTGDLTPAEIGILYGVISLVTLLSTYNDLGLTESLNYFLPKYIIKKDYARCKYLLFLAFAMQVVTSIILGLILYSSASFLGTWHFKSEAAIPIIQVMSLFFVGVNLMQVSLTLFTASQNTKFQKGIEFFRMFMTTIAIGALFFSDTGSLLSYAWVWIGGIFLTVIAATLLTYIIYYRQYFKGVKMKSDSILRKSLIKYSLGTFFSANIGMLLHQLDQQILQNMTNSTEGGIYAIYLSLIGIPFLFLTPIISFLFPVISELHSRGDNHKIQLIHGTFSEIMVIIMLWASALFLTIGIPISSFLFGENYAQSGQALSYIAPFLFLNILIQVNFQIMAGTGMIKKRVIILAKTLLLNAILVVLCISLYEKSLLPFPGAASATSFAVGASWVLMWILSHRAVRSYRGNISWYWIIKNTLMIVILLMAYRFLSISSHIPTLGLSGRLVWLPEIGFVFLSSIIIFLILNFRELQQFVVTIREVRKLKS